MMVCESPLCKKKKKKHELLKMTPSPWLVRVKQKGIRLTCGKAVYANDVW